MPEPEGEGSGEQRALVCGAGEAADESADDDEDDKHPPDETRRPVSAPHIITYDPKQM